MTSRDRVIKTLNHQPVDRAPRDLWAHPTVEKLRGDELAEMLFRFPSDFEKPDLKYPRGSRAKGKPLEPGQHTDAWGCHWRVTEPGTIGEPVDPPLADKAEIARYKPPLELLDPHRLVRAERAPAAATRFVLAWTETRPFERLQLLRGSEAALLDLSAGAKEVRSLLALLHDFSCQEMRLWAGSEVDGVALADNWGSANSLLVAPKLWRQVFKPMYREYCEILHAQDKFVFFRSDGNVSEILPELVEIGVDAIHAELFAMDLEALAGKHRGRITFWGDIDRRKTLPFGTPAEVRTAVERVRKAFDYGRGGLIAQCEWEPKVPFHNVAAVFDQWLRPGAAQAK
jgi:uroporphyrinogen decarboxylase